MKKEKRKGGTIHQHLSGILYPSSQKEIIEYVRQKGAGDGIIDLFKKIPNKQYKNESEILVEISEIQSKKLN